jgi:hypothetical protein
MRKGEVKGKNKCKIGKNYRKKATMGVEKRRVARGGKISFSEGEGGGENIVFGPKYRPLQKYI